MGASVRAKILVAADYLAVAPAVVNVVRDLDLPPFDARIRPSTPDQLAALTRLSAEWGLGASMTRAHEALHTRAGEWSVEQRMRPRQSTTGHPPRIG